jgi:hypothetical protein
MNIAVEVLCIARTRSARAVIVAAALGLIAGCSSGPDCGPHDQPYLSATTRPILEVPTGLTPPDRGPLLVIPESSSAPVHRSSHTACLDSPPSYVGAAGTAAGSPEDSVSEWAKAWSERDSVGVASFYSQSFASAGPNGSGSAAWIEQRRKEVSAGAVPSATLEDLKVVPQGSDRRVATFTQRFGTTAVHKELTLIRENGAWRIIAERVLDAG